jgi:hypothetical protein
MERLVLDPVALPATTQFLAEGPVEAHEQHI